MNSTESFVSLPPEIWIYIQRLATSETSPLKMACADRFQYVARGLADPLQDFEDFLRIASSFVLVCRLWNSLANEILYENIRVDDRFQALYTALKRPGTAPLVRSIRLSPTQFDHNYQILALCPQVQIVTQPDDLATSMALQLQLSNYPSLLQSALEPELPTFLSLRHIFCAELLIDSLLWRRIFRASPNLEYLFVSRSPSSTMHVDSIGLPPITSLKRLGFPQLARPMASVLLQMDLLGLTRLQCSPSDLSLLDFPTLPSLHTLELFGSRSTILFPAIFSRCPCLRELCYDVWNDVSPPREEHPSLSCIRLHSAVNVIRDWTPIEEHFALFLTPDFARLKCFILYGSWHRVIGAAQFTRFRDGLRERGCELEFPEGHVLH
ncbi:hypothetical protein FB451DRAFT_1554818 [Mycena latifolia]|nr:hypothetical protein FB451DRAFT_1554818 [Mycena latifolia]